MRLVSRFPAVLARLGALVALLVALGTTPAAAQPISVSTPPLAAVDPSATYYLFTYFVGNGEDGLHLAWSADGYKWSKVQDGSFLTPVVGEKKLMRDPCVLRGPDGTYHMVWTTAWEGKTIGYASTRDFITWSEQQAIPVMAHEPAARNCWAPEIVYDAAAKDFLLFWSTTITGRFNETLVKGDNAYNHRIYATRTRDFKTFTPTALFYEPGFNVIDATLAPVGDTFRLIVKDETIEPTPKKNLRVATGPRVDGPFTDLSAPFTRDWVEGPTVLPVGDAFLIYFDVYREKHYGAVRTRDFKTFEDVTAQISFPKGVRHGTAIAVPGSVIAKLLTHSATAALKNAPKQ